MKEIGSSFCDVFSAYWRTRESLHDKKNLDPYVAAEFFFFLLLILISGNLPREISEQKDYKAAKKENTIQVKNFVRFFLLMVILILISGKHVRDCKKMSRIRLRRVFFFFSRKRVKKCFNRNWSLGTGARKKKIVWIQKS
jgi:hypothetical protein